MTTTKTTTASKRDCHFHLALSSTSSGLSFVVWAKLKLKSDSRCLAKYFLKKWLSAQHLRRGTRRSCKTLFLYFFRFLFEI